MKKALVTGIAGQDGAYLSQYLLSLDYEVHGLIPRRVNQSLANLDFLGIREDINFVQGDLTDICSIQNVIKQGKYDEIYNLGAMSFVGSSWDQPVYTSLVNGLGPLYILEAVKNLSPNTKVYQASTSEMYGNCGGSEPKNESTPFIPRSPYGVAKVFAHNMMVNYRESYDMFCCNGILFNHESPLRGHEFVTRKISMGVAAIQAKKQSKIVLGNLDSKRDWGFAGDYVKGMYAMMQHDTPDDFVLATGKTYTIRDFLTACFQEIGISDWSEYVEQDPKFMRPAELDVLLGDATKAKEKLGWSFSVDMQELASIMVQSDMERLKC